MKKTKKELAAFANAVIDFHDHHAFGDPLDQKTQIAARKRWHEVFHVANGLIALRQLANQELDSIRRDQLKRLGESGVRDALSLLDALTTGRRQAVFDLIDGLRWTNRKERNRPNAVAITDIDGLVASIRLLIHAGELDGKKLKKSQAIEMIIATCKLKPEDFPRYERVRTRKSNLTPHQHLVRHIRDLENGWKRPQPDETVATLLRQIEEKRGARSWSKSATEMIGMWAKQTFYTPPPPFSRLSKSP
jgi:hypothetical protein